MLSQRNFIEKNPWPVSASPEEILSAISICFVWRPQQLQYIGFAQCPSWPYAQKTKLSAENHPVQFFLYLMRSLDRQRSPAIPVYVPRAPPSFHPFPPK